MPSPLDQGSPQVKTKKNYTLVDIHRGHTPRFGRGFDNQKNVVPSLEPIEKRYDACLLKHAKSWSSTLLSSSNDKIWTFTESNIVSLGKLAWVLPIGIDVGSRGMPGVWRCLYFMRVACIVAYRSLRFLKHCRTKCNAAFTDDKLLDGACEAQSETNEYQCSSRDAFLKRNCSWWVQWHCASLVMSWTQELYY